MSASTFHLSLRVFNRHLEVPEKLRGARAHDGISPHHLLLSLLEVTTLLKSTIAMFPFDRKRNIRR